MSTISIIKWANSLGITEPVNGSWIEAIARHYGDYGNAPHIISIAKSMGITEAKNGSWIQTMAEHSGVSEGPWLNKMVNTSSPSELPTPPIDPCSVISGVTSDNIGPLGSSRLYYSWYKLYNYNNTGWVYTQSEIGDCKTITGIEIAFRAYSWGDNVYDNQKIYLAHIEEDGFSSQSTSFNLFNDNTITDLTLVYDGTFNIPDGDPVNVQFDFDTNFTYNGSGNLLVMIIDESGTYSYSYPAFKGMSGNYLPNTYPSFYDYSDSVLDINTDLVTRYNYRPNTKLLY